MITAATQAEIEHRRQTVYDQVRVVLEQQAVQTLAQDQPINVDDLAAFHTQMLNRVQGAQGIFTRITRSEQGEINRRHAAQFEVLYWIQPTPSADRLMVMLNQLLSVLWEQPIAPQQVSYRTLMLQRVGIDSLEDSPIAVKQHLQRLGLRAPAQATHQALLTCAFEQMIEPSLAVDEPRYVTSLPNGQSLALYFDGLKLLSVMQVTDTSNCAYDIIQLGVDHWLMAWFDVRDVARVQGRQQKSLD